MIRYAVHKQLEDAVIVSAHKQSELNLLQSQLSPHFLFNTLNNIHSITVLKRELIPGLLLNYRTCCVIRSMIRSRNLCLWPINWLIFTIISSQVDYYKNIPLSIVNDHTVRLSVMTEPFYWHYHPNSDETFLVLEGVLCIDLEDRTVELSPHQLITIPANVVRRTRPNYNRSVNITFESQNIQTVKSDT